MMINCIKLQETLHKQACRQYFRREEARHEVKLALKQWQQACDAWLLAKCRIYNSKDYEAIDQARAIKNHIDQAAIDLKQALHRVNAVSHLSTIRRSMETRKRVSRRSAAEKGFCRAD